MKQNIRDEGRDEFMMLPRDCTTVFAYWIVTNARLKLAETVLGKHLASSSLIMSVHDITGTNYNGHNARSSREVFLPGTDGGMFIDGFPPGSALIAEIGIKTRSGLFPLLQSNCVKTPGKRPGLLQIPAQLVKGKNKENPQWLSLFSGYSIYEGE